MYLTHANFEIKLFFKSDQLPHIGAKIFFNPLLKTRLQQNMKHTCNYKWLKEAALCHPDKAAHKCWLYYLLPVSLGFSQIKSVSSAWVSHHHPPHRLQIASQYLSVTTCSSYCSLPCFLPAPSFWNNTESPFTLINVYCSLTSQNMTLKTEHEKICDSLNRWLDSHNLLTFSNGMQKSLSSMKGINMSWFLGKALWLHLQPIFHPFL